MDRYEAVPRVYQPHEHRENATCKLIDRFGLKPAMNGRPCDPGYVPVGYTHDLSGNRFPRYHTPLEAKFRVEALNAGHLRAWIETNYPAVWIAYKIQKKPRLNKPVECRRPYTDSDIKDRQSEFGLWLERERPGLIARFAAFNNECVNKETEK